MISTGIPIIATVPNMDPSGKHRKVSRSNCIKKFKLFFYRELPAIVALSQPCSKLPIEAAMATNTAPPMAAEIYACTDTTHATAACVVSSSFIIPNPAVLQQRRRTKEQSGLEKNKATKNKSGSKRTSLQRTTDPSRREGSRLPLLRRRRPRFVIPDRARGLLKQRRRRVLRWPDGSCGEFWQSRELSLRRALGLESEGGRAVCGGRPGW